jgi:hypothetical protein
MKLLLVAFSLLVGGYAVHVATDWMHTATEVMTAVDRLNR